MTRYIDGEHLRAWILSRWEMTAPYSAYPLKACEIIDQIEREMEYPIVDAVPVRHGRWIKMNDTVDDEECNGYKCSNCGEWMDYRSHYCPNCGARMDEK